MQELIEADILIMAKGCFSYCAGLISDGIKIFEPITLSADNNLMPGWRWWYLAPTDNWLPCLADGSFDCAAFERQLLFVIQTRAKATAAAIAPTGGSDHDSNDLT